MGIIKDKFFDMKLYQHNDQTTILTTCRGCDEVIEPRSWYYLEVTHPLHPEPHLVMFKYDYSDLHSCAFCNRTGASPRCMYRCESCEFYVDLMCGEDATFKFLSTKSPEERERMSLKDLSHHHQLKLLNIQMCKYDDDDDNDDEVTHIQHCRACQQPIIDVTYYICTEESEECKDYYLHKFCAELPVEMKHATHPLHQLTLMLSSPVDHFKCFACGKFCKGHIYSCRKCSFQLDIICATSMSRVLEHKCHQHPLTVLPRPISSFCYACCRVQRGIFYHCSTCVGFFIHQDCASLAYEMNHRSHQGHPLRLGYHSDGTKKKNECDICYKPIYNHTGWFYYCWECKFYGHLNCIRSDNDPEIIGMDPQIPCLPWRETNNEFGTIGLLKMKLTSIQNDEDTIDHFSHPEHPLILQTDVPREANPYSDGEITLIAQCNGCCKQISAPLYSCEDCHFYIHKGCAQLPSFIDRHHAHSEHENCRLLLVREPWYETQVFICDDCEDRCNGFSYQCEEESCDYQIDVECAFLPSTIVHKSHPFHTLALVPKDFYFDNRFNCCSTEYRSQENRIKWCSSYNPYYVYKCVTCAFSIHTKCAMYPANANHRYDWDSPFMLCYNPSEIEPNEYHYCQICEFRLDPKRWFYFSRKIGGQIIHSECLLRGYRGAVVYPNFKSISSVLNVDIHPHRLNLNPTFPFDKCHHCKMEMEDHNNNTSDIEEPLHFSYQCVEWDCEHEINAGCTNKFILQAEENAQETVRTGISDIQQLYLEGSGSAGL